MLMTKVSPKTPALYRSFESIALQQHLANNSDKVQPSGFLQYTCIIESFLREVRLKLSNKKEYNVNSNKVEIASN